MRPRPYVACSARASPWSLPYDTAMIAVCCSIVHQRAARCCHTVLRGERRAGGASFVMCFHRKRGRLRSYSTMNESVVLGRPAMFEVWPCRLSGRRPSELPSP